MDLLSVLAPVAAKNVSPLIQNVLEVLDLLLKLERLVSEVVVDATRLLYRAAFQPRLCVCLCLDFLESFLRLVNPGFNKELELAHRNVGQLSFSEGGNNEVSASAKDCVNSHDITP